MAFNQISKIKSIRNGVIHSIPLSIAMIPWGFLFGALAIEVQMSPWQAQLMSLIIYAGAAQISAVSIIKLSVDPTLLMSTTTIIGSRHLLYSAALQQEIINRPLYQRLSFAMLLTDELFAIIEHRKNQKKTFNYIYSLTAGFSFFIIWNIATFLGIYISKSLPNIEKLGLEFAIVATFIAITVPKMKDKSIFIGAVSSGLLAIFFEIINLSNMLLVSGIFGMLIGYFSSIILSKKTI